MWSKMLSEENIEIFKSYINNCEEIESAVNVLLNMIGEDLKEYSVLTTTSIYSPTKIMELETLTRRLSFLKTKYHDELLRQGNLQKRVQELNTVNTSEKLEQKEYPVCFQLEQLHADCFQMDYDIQKIEKSILKNYGTRSSYAEAEKRCNELKQQLASLDSAENCMKREVECLAEQLNQILKHSDLNEEVNNKIWNAVDEGEIDDIGELIENQWKWYIS
uniref:Uncharacterized protein n=1 Tax=Trichobilharzia regenti TaxID=157069 RepID=A0AA85JEB6_TRIRE|nr:unnamed protein product [Trichobilharzia regenti]